MVDIITENGIALDLDPECVFEIEYGQPLLIDDHCPVPFTTPIGFLPTKKNKKVFGFLDALMLDPEKRRVKASLHFNGVPLMNGTLVYENYEDGVINYSFTSKNVEDDWSAPIGTQLDPNQFTVGPQGYSREEAIGQIKNTTKYPIAAPPIIVEGTASKTINNGTAVPHIEDIAKYMNIPYKESRFIPVLKVKDILLNILGEDGVGQDIQETFNELALMAPYDPDYISGSFYFNVGEMLPNISVYELLRDVAKMLCASTYFENNKYKLVSANEVLNSKECEDWDGQVSDSYSLSNEPGKKYKFGYHNSDDKPQYNIDNLSHDIYTGEIGQRVNYQECIESFPDCSIVDRGISSVLHSNTGEIFSGKSIRTRDGLLFGACENVYDKNIPINTSSSSEDEVFDNSVELNLIKCVPDAIGIPDGTASYVSVGPFAIVKPPLRGEPAGKDAFIGMLHAHEGAWRFTAFNRCMNFDNVVDHEFSGLSLNPGDLFAAYHKTFADWLTTDKQVVTVDLLMDTPQLLNLKMYRKVYFRGFYWLPKSIQVVLSPSSNSIEASGEFIKM